MVQIELRIGNARRRHGGSIVARLKHIVVVNNVAAQWPDLKNLENLVVWMNSAFQAAILRCSVTGRFIIDHRFAVAFQQIRNLRGSYLRVSAHVLTAGVGCKEIKRVVFLIVIVVSN